MISRRRLVLPNLTRFASQLSQSADLSVLQTFPAGETTPLQDVISHDLPRPNTKMT